MLAHAMRPQTRLFPHALAWLILAQCLSLDGWSGMAANRKLTEADRKVWPLFEAAVTNLNKGEPRRRVADQFERITRDHPGSFYDDRASEYARVLKQMSEADAAFQMPTDPLALPVQAQVEVWLFRLRDCDAVQWSQPGHTWVPSLFLDPPHLMEPPVPNPADRLIALGFDAVPSLIVALDDTRLTRAYGFRRNFDPLRYVLRYGDVAVQILEMIAGQSFYQPTTTSSYLLSENLELRQSVKQKIIDWWSKAGFEREESFLRAKIAELNQQIAETHEVVMGRGPALYLNRLARIEGANALPDIRAYGAGGYIRGARAGYFCRLLIAGGDRVLGEVQTAANPNSDEFEYGAALALFRFGHLDEAAFKDLLYTATVNICRNTKSPPIRVNQGLLADTRDDRCALLLAGIARFNQQDYVLSYKADISESDHKPAAQVLAMIREQTALPGLGRSLNHLLGNPLGDLRPDEFQKPELWERLFDTCAQRGIEPATAYPWEQAD
jgi:hypothetical protein